MLKDLCALCGTSGYEDDIITFIETILKRNDISYKTDRLGNIVVKQGKSPENIALFAHMDEVGLVVRGITEDGMIKFAAIGGISAEILLSSQVIIGKNKINGVIGNIPKHLIKKKSKKADKIEINDLFIDIGTTSKKEALKYVSIGDPIYFNSEYIEFGDGLVKAKALDDRASIATILKLLLEKKYSFTACFTTREEIGLIGAKIISQKLKINKALILEVTTCVDMPKTSCPSTVLGNGVALSIIDNGSASNLEFNDVIRQIAGRHKVKLQDKLTTKGGNDAGAVSYYSGGTKTAVLSIPGRYIHTPHTVISKSDYKAMEKLVTFILEYADTRSGDE